MWRSSIGCSRTQQTRGSCVERIVECQSMQVAMNRATVHGGCRRAWAGSRPAVMTIWRLGAWMDPRFANRRPPSAVIGVRGRDTFARRLPRQRTVEPSRGLSAMTPRRFERLDADVEPVRRARRKRRAACGRAAHWISEPTPSVAQRSRWPLDSGPTALRSGVTGIPGSRAECRTNSGAPFPRIARGQSVFSKREPLTARLRPSRSFAVHPSSAVARERGSSEEQAPRRVCSAALPPGLGRLRRE
jgi:hypothetical protein